MSSDNKNAISEAFSARLASLQSMIDDLVNSHSEERAFISANLIQYAIDADDIARQLPQEVVQNNFYDLSIGNAASTPTEASGTWRDWIVDLPDSPPLLNLPNEEFLHLSSDNCVGGNQYADISKLTNILYCTSDRLRAEQTLGRSVTVQRDCADDSQSTAIELLRSTTPAVVRVASAEHVGQPACTTLTSRSGERTVSPDAAQTRSLKDGKKSRRQNNSGSNKSNDMADMSHSKKRHMRSSTSHNKLQQSCFRTSRKQIHGLTESLNDMYFATVGSEALCQLRGMIDAIRGMNGSTLAVGPTTMVETLRMLDTLENFQHATVFLRRTCFLKLWKLREIFVARFTNDREQRTDEEQPTAPVIGRPESNILDDLLTEGYPEIAPRPYTGLEVRKWRKEYEKQRKSLKNRIQIAKKWNTLSKKFRCGILAVIPSGGQFEISNHKLETLPDTEFKRLLDLLDGRPDKYFHRLADLLTPFVEAILNGQEYEQTSRLERDISALINQFEEASQPSGSTLKEVRITASIVSNMVTTISQ